MHIDPYAWILTFPITIGLVQLYFQPPENLLKRFLHEARRLEAQAWERLGWPMAPALLGEQRMVRKVLFFLTIAGLAGSSLASFGAFVGMLPSA